MTSEPHETLDAQSIRDLQQHAQRRAIARVQRIQAANAKLRDFLRSIHSAATTDELIGYLASTARAAEAQWQSPVTRWLPGRLYRWIARKIFIPCTIPYVQIVLLRYHDELAELLADQLYIRELIAGADGPEQRPPQLGLAELERKIDSLAARLAKISPEASS